MRGGGGEREREGERGCHSQTGWLQQDLHHTVSYDSRGQRLSPLMNIGPRPVALAKKKGSCFHSHSLESLFLEFSSASTRL